MKFELHGSLPAGGDGAELFGSASDGARGTRTSHRATSDARPQAGRDGPLGRDPRLRRTGATGPHLARAPHSDHGSATSGTGDP